MTLTLHLSSHGDFELTNFHLEKSLSQALESLDLVENIRTQLLKFFTDDQELNSENFSQDCQSTLTNFKQNVVKDQLSDIKIVWQGTNKCNLFLDGLDDSASLNLSYSPAEELPSGDEEEETVPESTGLQLKMAFDDAGIKVKGTKGGKLVIDRNDQKKVLQVVSKSLKRSSDAKKVIDKMVVFEEVEDQVDPNPEKSISKLFSHVKELMKRK